MGSRSYKKHSHLWERPKRGKVRNLETQEKGTVSRAISDPGSKPASSSESSGWQPVLDTPSQAPPTQDCLEYKGKFRSHLEAELKLQSQSLISWGGAFCSTLVNLARNLWKTGSCYHTELV